MKYLYYCNSTYQLLNVLNLHWHRKYASFENINNYKADIIIQNSFEGADEISEIVKKEDTFEKVYLLEKVFNNGSFHALKTVIDIVFPILFLKSKHNIRIEEIANNYNVICTPKYSLLIDQIWRLNKKASLDLIEDGIGSYHLSMLFEPRSESQKRLRKFLNCNDFSKYNKLYLVNKGMYVGKDEYKVIEIPKYDKDYLGHVKNMFKYYADNYDEKKVYWLSQFLNNNEFNDMMAGVLEKLVPYKNDVLFCQHPRTYMDNIHGFSSTDGKQIWELQILNMNNVSNKLFISIHSTACFSAKMLFDEEPYIIMFYRMGDKKVTGVTDSFEESVRRFIASYRHPEKVMLPETLEEFEQCIDKYFCTN